MNEFFKKVVQSVKDLWAKWSLVQKLIVGGIVLVFLLGIVAVTRFSASPTTAPLFSTAVTDEALRERIIARANLENVVVIDNGSGILTVKDEETAERIRAILVQDDLVPGNVDPWALFDVQRWTITDFERNVNLRRSITETVRRHIEALDDVDRADVIINMPEKTLFAADQDPVTASVIITPKPGSDITENRKKIQGIQKLLKFAVSGLQDDFITITDQNSNVLNDWEGYEASERVDIIAKEQKLISQLEAQYRAKVLKSLQATFSPDRVRDLNVKIDMDMSQQVVDSTEYSPIVITPDNPDTPYDDSRIVESIVLSSQEETKSFEGMGINPEGPAGVEGQNPPVYTDMSNLHGKTEESSKKQNNAVNSRQVRSEKSPGIDRITVSVNIDGEWKLTYDENGERIWKDGMLERQYIPISPEVLESVTLQVQNAIGYNKSRGDSVSVHNIPFDRTEEFLRSDGKV
ncbi:MAG: flagellar M-ring protein FliF, partial [Spirochaetaceae bacterium]|nr:flagellar M-ring protein FliF [Spirochaetaceae bacterium]